jgi:hypothetical protein
MSVKVTKGSLAKINAENIDEDRFVLHCIVCSWIWSPGFPHNYSRRAKGMLIYPSRFNDPKLNTNSDTDEQIGVDRFFLIAKRRMYGKRYTK